MLKRDLQSITLKLSDLKEYEVVRQKRKNLKAQGPRPRLSMDALASDDIPSTSGTATSSCSQTCTGTGPGSSSGSGSGSGSGSISLSGSGPRSETPSSASYTNSTTPTGITQEEVFRPSSAVTGTTSGSMDDVSVAAVVDDTDTIDELSDDNWQDLNAETNTDTNDTIEEVIEEEQEVEGREEGEEEDDDEEEDGARGGI